MDNRQGNFTKLKYIMLQFLKKGNPNQIRPKHDSNPEMVEADISCYYVSLLNLVNGSIYG